jgi:hypothetical protein
MSMEIDIFPGEAADYSHARIACRHCVFVANQLTKHTKLNNKRHARQFVRLVTFEGVFAQAGPTVTSYASLVNRMIDNQQQARKVFFACLIAVVVQVVCRA